MQINNYTVIDRHSRPGVLQKVALRAFFVNDGAYQDPFEISSVTVFKLSDNTSPSTILDVEQLIDTSAASAVVKMHFKNNTSYTSSTSAFSPSNYTANSTASGIYKLATGQYAVVLAPNVSTTFAGSSFVNKASGVGDYIDVWTIRFSPDTDFKTYINEFTLHDDTLFTTTQPLLVTAANKLRTKHIKLGSKVDLTIGTEFTIGNKDIDSGIKNIFKDSVITDASIQIVKLNDDYTLPARVTVSSFANTSSLTDVTSDSTIIFNWDTNALYTLSSVQNGTFGPITGAYQVQVKFNLLNQTILSDYMNLILS
jgi:hypothetical protein